MQSPANSGELAPDRCARRRRRLGAGFDIFSDLTAGRRHRLDRLGDADNHGRAKLFHVALTHGDVHASRHLPGGMQVVDLAVAPDREPAA